jgi:hypothetical protein
MNAAHKILVNGEGFNMLLASLLLTSFVRIPSLSEYCNVCSPPKATPALNRRVFYIQIPSKSEVGAVIQSSRVICFCTNAELPSQIIYKVALILFLISTYDGACKSFNIPSYIPNMIAALGTVLSR